MRSAGGDFQGKTGQSVSAAKIFPQGHQYEKEAEAHGVSTWGRQNDKEAGAHDVRGSSMGAATNWFSDEDLYSMAHTSVRNVVNADLKAMQDLADKKLVDDCSIQVTITCPEAMFLGPPPRVPGPSTPSTPQAARITGPQPTVNPAIPPMCQKVVAAFNRLHPGMSVLELCKQGKVCLGQLRVGQEGACVNFGLLGRCSGCQYRHEVCTVAPSRQVSIFKVMESALATMKVAAGA